MTIGILGAGNVGGTLGKRWAQAGHRVIFASREPSSAKIQALTEEAGNGATAASAEETVAVSDIVLLATPWEATKSAVQAIPSWEGKILIDATNPLLPGLSGLEYANTSSGAEEIAGWAPGARVIKAFNTIGFNIMANPQLNGESALLLYCGDDKAAKEIVRGLALELGFAPEDAGPLRDARLLEPFALLWISLAMLRGYGREIAFQLLRR